MLLFKHKCNPPHAEGDKDHVDAGTTWVCPECSRVWVLTDCGYYSDKPVMHFLMWVEVKATA